MSDKQLIPATHHSLEPIFERAIANVREDMADNPYLIEALRVLPVGGYRSAIGSFWKEALAHDDHFQQAGFVALLRDRYRRSTPSAHTLNPATYLWRGGEQSEATDVRTEDLRDVR